MRKYLLPVILFFSMATIAQKRDSIYNPIDVEKLKKQVDSSTKMLDTLFDNQLKRMQDKALEEKWSKTAATWNLLCKSSANVRPNKKGITGYGLVLVYFF